MGTLEILDRIERTKGRKDKMQILRDNSSNTNLTRMLLYGMNPYAAYWFSDVPTWSTLPVRSSRIIKFEPFFDLLDRLNAREITGSQARSVTATFFDGLHPKAQKWFGRVLQKNLRLGISYVSVNSVIPGLIPGFEVQLAHPLREPLEDISWPRFVDTKLDGIRCVVTKEYDGTVEMRTRKGFLIETLPTLQRQFERWRYKSFMLDGEAMGADWNESQSIITSTVNKKVEKGVIFHAFDYLELRTFREQGSSPAYKDRLDTLKAMLHYGGCPENVRLVESYWVKQPEMAGKLYQEFLSKGCEGAMLKDPEAPYEFKRTKAVLKLKPRDRWTGIVVGLEEGAGKLDGKLGALYVNIGGVITKVGSGFDEPLRQEIWDNQHDYMERLVEVTGQDMTKDGKVRFPVFVGWRSSEDVGDEDLS